MSANFWRDQTTWPRDRPEMVFLGRAADQLGRALLGEKWTGKEPCAEILPPARDAQATNNLIARHLSQFGRREYHGSMAPPPVSPIGGPHVIHTDRRPTFEFTEQELKALVLFMQQHNEAALEAQARFRKLQNAITEYAVAGRLGTSFRAFAGGTLHPIRQSGGTRSGLSSASRPAVSIQTTRLVRARKRGFSCHEPDIEKIIREAAPTHQATINTEVRCQKWLEEEFGLRLCSRGDFGWLSPTRPQCIKNHASFQWFSDGGRRMTALGRFLFRSVQYF